MVVVGYRVRIALEGLGGCLAELQRILAPRTIEALVRALPIASRAFPGRSYVYFQVPLEMGVEKPRSEVEEGALAYWPQARAVCVFLKRAKFDYDVSLLGKVVEGLSILSEIKAGTPLTVELASTIEG
ncbi:MAG: cyclophilin-like fold protein [Candidatus Nezhaarchaeota archaeon]|nr:cyclophilin-like fold protein [Candidatus Nezhaarchaeota archaeon]